jgi:hypothetical protein
MRDPNRGKTFQCEYEWTTTPPTEPGWYWYQPHLGLPAVPVRVRRYDGKMVFLNGIQEGYLSNATGEWWPVPIPEPPRG